MVDRKEIEGTPFTMIRQTDDKGIDKYFIVMGDHRLTEPTFTEHTQLEILQKDHWKILVNVIAIVTDKMIYYYKPELEEQIKKANEALKSFEKELPKMNF